MAGLLITFEGLDRSGKETQIRLLKTYLDAQRIPYVCGREPGGTGYVEAARRMVQDPAFLHRINIGYAALKDAPVLETDADLTPAAELFCYLIARSMFIEQLVKPALAQGKLFIADRLGDSSVAYQGYGNWEGEEEKISFIKMCNARAYDTITITRTYLLDISAEECFARRSTQEFGNERDRIEQRKKEYFTRVRKGYLTLAQQEPQRFVVLDGTKTKQELHAEIIQDIHALLDAQ